jgi:L-aminopeptidase/D-esterase-like protein
MKPDDMSPITDLTGDRLTFDFSGFRIGTAEYGPGLTGCTLFLFDEKAATAVDIRGGDPAVSEYGYDGYDAICFAGGSMQGLEVLAGVRAALFDDYGPDRDLVTCAAVNDWYQRERTVNPDKRLGIAAYARATPNQFLMGRHGAGANVWVGGGKGRGVGEPEQAGQGAAFGQYGPVRIAVFTVVNAFGAIVDRQGRVVCGNFQPSTGERSHHLTGLTEGQPSPEQPSRSTGNTTLTMVITNQKLTHHQLRQTGRQIHSSMARAIQPFHTVYDGDVLYLASTMAVQDTNLDTVSLGLLGSELAWDAVLSAAAGQT